MKILIIQENGRHEENRHFRECYSLQNSFNKLGHNTVVWGLGHENYSESPSYNEYDLILNLENYAHTAGNWLPDLSITKTTKLLWSIDAHCLGLEMFEKEYSRGKYDFILHSTKDFATKDHHIWFPNSFDQNLVVPIDVEKEHDFGFCGSYVNRKEILHWLQQHFGLHMDIFVIGENMVKAINSYKCHFNLNMSWTRNSAINYRNFETIGCGTLLLTSDSSEYSELGFKDGENCFIYSSVDELQKKINFIKNNDVSEVAAAGLKLSKNHTYDQRVKKLLEDIE